MEEEARVDISDTLADDLFNALAIAPPMFGVVVRIRNRDHANFRLVAKRLLEEQTGAPGMSVLSQHIDASHSDLLLAKPIAQGERGTVGPIPIIHSAGHHLHQI